MARESAGVRYWSRKKGKISMSVDEIISTLVPEEQPNFLKYILNNDITNQAEIISSLAPRLQDEFLKYLIDNGISANVSIFCSGNIPTKI
jgi:hypothetical protein